MTYDQGKKLSRHFQIIENTENIGGKVYFVDPHRPWKRGINANSNRIIKTTLAKGRGFEYLYQIEIKLDCLATQHETVQIVRV